MNRILSICVAAALGAAHGTPAAGTLDLDAITYEELADPKWQGKICIRSGQHPYNTGLFAAYLAHHGAEATETC